MFTILIFLNRILWEIRSGYVKNEEGTLRDEFIGKMFELNARIRLVLCMRCITDSALFGTTSTADGTIWLLFWNLFLKFHESMACKFQKENSIGATAEPDEEVIKQVVVQADSKALEDKLADVLCEIAKEEEAFLAAQNIQKKLQQEQVDIEKKVSLMELIVKETKALQDLARYPLKNYISV
ncbi:hypothetical protein Tsubulata_036980 [Turnera subulata]|uniref:Uncharacterized protein n=1 Tax=Turnera subulata TaxID=218843 RepID=A0A9Q0JE72_9ROSI|nr:hypothetical protein Tsubulata_036980 [Turnera subulata]